MKIISVIAREILDSRGNPTVEVEVITESGFGSAIAPSGASTGIHEALELRDGGARFHGKGVLQAVKNVNEIIAPGLLGMDVSDQDLIDKKLLELDGTKNKGKLGANATVATSMAVLRAAASSSSVPLYEYLGGTTLPRAMFNIVNGGKHAGGKLAVQEFMIVPEDKLFSKRLQMASEIYHTLGQTLSKKFGPAARNVGDEGGFAPPIDNTYKAFDEIVAAIEESGYSGSCFLALDCAASSFFEKDAYSIDGKSLSASDMIEYYKDLVKTYPIRSIEDPFAEDDFASFAALTSSLSGIQVVGDDLLVTNPSRIKEAISKKACNALLLKVNQIGTVTEAIEASNMCKKAGMNVIVSHRSGESEDTFIADFAVGLDAGQIKTGAPARSERTAKYNQLLRIEDWIFVKEELSKLGTQ
ncbi:phosphopyruvate hydratase [Candidatus Micrarchaeota archaeon]|nr:phosphopyruvate hydratase [Candidatus Micrarchaeota archaeon]